MDNDTARTDELTALREVATRLLRDLDEARDYATHDSACEYWVSRKCTCGFNDLDLRAMRTVNDAIQKGIKL